MAEATPPTTTWEEIRRNLVEKGSIKELKVAGTEEYAYYVALSDVQFRHAGDPDKTAAPAKVSLVRPPVNVKGNEISYAKLDSIVGVHYSSSGTGKTVDLAGASYIRKTQLSFFTSIEDGYLSGQEFLDTIQRNKSAIEAFKRQLFNLLTQEKVRGVENILGGILSVGELRLSVCLDEASKCPVIVRSIISNPTLAEEAVRNAICEAIQEFGKENKSAEHQDKAALQDASQRLRVLFSVGGTGASCGSVGSMEKNYEHLKTSASLQPEKVYNALLTDMVKDEELRHTYSYNAITTNTLLKVLVDGNARMTSILVQSIGDMGSDAHLDNRAILVDTLEKFPKSNGLQCLEDQASKCKVAAQAVAVHLFQKKYEVPVDADRQAEALIKMDYHGVNFEKSIGPYPSITLVAQFGLLEPEPFSAGGEEIAEPFRLPPAMQVMTMFMMGFSNISPLELSSFGFEVLSTQMIKSAIAAALTVSFSTRPNLDEILCKQLKFQLPDEMSTEGAKAWLRKLSSLKPVQIKLSKDDFRRTRLHRARAAIKQKIVKREDGGHKVARYVFFDEELGDELIGLSQDEDGCTGFCPPLCSVSTGNSDLVDGYVTFFVTSIEGSNSSGIEVKDWTEEQVAGLLEEIGMPQYKENLMKVPGVFLDILNEAMLLRVGVDKKDLRAILDALYVAKGALEPRGEKMTVCNQAKDYHNAKLPDSSLNDQAERVRYECLKEMFGDRLYCVASNKQAWERGPKGRTVFRDYLAFDVSESKLLGGGVIDMADLRNQTLQDLKHGKDYDSNLVDFPDTSLEEYLAGLSMAEIKKLEEQSQEDPSLLKNVKKDIERRKSLANQRKRARRSSDE